MLELMMRGALDGRCEFMSSAECESVRTCGRLFDGTAWPVPVLLPVPEKFASGLRPGVTIALRDREGIMLAAMRIRGIWRDPCEVERVRGRHETAYLAGPVTGIQLPTYYSFEQFRPSAGRIRSEFVPAGLSIAFIAARPVHRLDFDILTAVAQEMGRRVLIIGALPPTADTNDMHPIIRCWLHAVEQSHGLMHLSLWPIPHSKDGLFLAGAVAASAGCEQIFSERSFGSNDLASRMRTWPDTGCRLPASLPGEAAAIQADGQVIELLKQGCPIPESLTFPSVVRELSSLHPPRAEQGLTVFFTGLSGSGKSTIANAVREVLLARGGRQITLLDGDVVRQQLSSELGFSRQDRETNVMRIGFVAAEITKHRGMAICAPIAPYEELRVRVRAAVEAYGAFVLVYLSTPLDVCEQRDCKGLYAKARCGLIENFTGISDVYEEPVSADIVIDTSNSTPRDAVESIISWLECRGYVPKNPASPVDSSL